MLFIKALCIESKSLYYTESLHRKKSAGEACFCAAKVLNLSDTPQVWLCRRQSAEFVGQPERLAFAQQKCWICQTHRRCGFAKGKVLNLSDSRRLVFSVAENAELLRCNLSVQRAAKVFYFISLWNAMALPKMWICSKVTPVYTIGLYFGFSGRRRIVFSSG